MTDATAATPPQPLRHIDTFVPPDPSPRLIKALAPVNRVVCLGGVPGLRSLPMIGRLPGIRGLADVRSIDFPKADEARLRVAAAPDNATFIAPNHPEFFTDWMLDKEILSRVAPLAACWATNSIVNGMGRLAQRFWLKNNLIAQIPGIGGGAARAHSIAWAADGHGVLLHPEGTVGWHGDKVGRLYPGAIEMAAEAAAIRRQKGLGGRALAQPVVWKLIFTEDATDGLDRELGHVERQLELPSMSDALSVRILAAYRKLLIDEAAQWGLPQPRDSSFDQQQRSVLTGLADRLRLALGTDVPADLASSSDPEPSLRPLLRTADRRLRGPDALAENRRTEIKGLIESIRRSLRFRPSLYPGPELTQEHLAEIIKRLRGDHCHATFADRFDRMVPRPAAPRIVHIRVPEPVDVGATVQPGGSLTEAQSAELVLTLRRRMQDALDAIVRMTDATPRTKRFVNVFHT